MRFVAWCCVVFMATCVYHTEAKDVVSNTTTSRYMGSVYKGNYVWGGAMNLAWTDLCSSILKAPLKFHTDNTVVLTMERSFNTPVFTKKDLDEKSYYIQSGYGQKTVDRINKGTRKKFPKKSIPDLELTLAPTDIIAYAYFLKEVQYLTVFEKKTVSFNGEKVEGFYAKNDGQRDNVTVLFYHSDDKFIVSLQLKDKNDQLIIAKGYPMVSPDEVLGELTTYSITDAPVLRKTDIFEAPKLHLSMRRIYQEFIGQIVATKGFESYSISQMFENIKFDMDEKGARVENEAVIVMIKGMPMQEKMRKFILNSPYWIIMKRKDSMNPYFLLGVNNTELMMKTK